MLASWRFRSSNFPAVDLLKYYTAYCTVLAGWVWGETDSESDARYGCCPGVAPQWVRDLPIRIVG